MITMSELLNANGNDLTDHDLAHLADWANGKKNDVANPMWQRAFSLLREGADTLLRRRAMSKCDIPAVASDHEVKPAPTDPHVGKMVDYLELREQLNDFKSAFYGPHPCSRGCDAICVSPLIIRQSQDNGGAAWEWDGARYVPHWHRKAEALRAA